ncbi:MAG: hypothetical protein JWO36_2411 [Myxococcales bacterium]|nr:hypothetical protein [Myxococcales bacterium]
MVLLATGLFSRTLRRRLISGTLASALVAALVIGGTAGIALGVTAGGALLVWAGREVVRSNSAFDRARRRMHDARYWPRERSPNEENEWDLYERDRVTGTWSGCRVWFGLSTAGATAIAQIANWPSELSLELRRDPGDATTGDEAFDRLVHISCDDAFWRPTLTSEVRARVLSIVSNWNARVLSGQLVFELGPAEVDQLERVLDTAAELAAATRTAPADAAQAVLDLIPAEPIPSVRWGHYRWIVETGWNVPLTLRAAASDEDTQIAAWARAQLGPEVNVFR